ncbi:DUF6508 domain-containing protein [Tabrizicola sp. J26]|uniref:DUF6508 domain-containing protein n=1 Tax=Alitabrizicola rongguiensis TaxID=2909234 RepID=UPI001F3AC277|nr:DUF6508 domain-containing protein [Tabrizicola rongguiensis]MCF1708695.1 DUF6508 domain-containing protein [Tabrizicola rongguiensis]
MHEPKDIRAALEAITTFLPRLEDPAFRGGTWVHRKLSDGHRQMPFVHYDRTIVELVEQAYQQQWVRRDLPWPKWSQTAEAKRFRDHPEEIAQATLEQLVLITTADIRADRFCEGRLLQMIESGMLLLIVRRMRAILTELGS